MHNLCHNFSHKTTIAFISLITHHVGELWHKLCHFIWSSIYSFQTHENIFITWCAYITWSYQAPFFCSVHTITGQLGQQTILKVKGDIVTLPQKWSRVTSISNSKVAIRICAYIQNEIPKLDSNLITSNRLLHANICYSQTEYKLYLVFKVGFWLHKSGKVYRMYSNKTRINHIYK